MIASVLSADSTPQMLQDWRRQIRRPERSSTRRPVRPFAVISYLLRRSPRQSGRSELRNLTLVALFDEQLPSGRIATRLVGVSGRLGPDGLAFGGPELTRFDKDLRMPPVAGGPGRRFDPARGSLLAFALQLDRYLEKCARYPYYPRRPVPQLPQLALACGSDDSPFVALSGVHKRQVITYTSAGDLRGAAGSSCFDFYTTRYHRAPGGS